MYNMRLQIYRHQQCINERTLSLDKSKTKTSKVFGKASLNSQDTSFVVAGNDKIHIQKVMTPFILLVTFMRKVTHYCALAWALWI